METNIIIAFIYIKYRKKLPYSDELDTCGKEINRKTKRDVAANGGKRTRWVEIMGRGGTEGSLQGGMVDALCDTWCPRNL